MPAHALITDADCRRLRDLARRVDAPGRARPRLLAALRHRLAGARIVGRADIPPDVVTLNSRVKLCDLDTGRPLVLTLAHPLDVGLFGDRLSVASPCGAALLGRRVGQVVHWPLGPRLRRLRIEQVIYQPEAAGDEHL
jgi:regulator of nucleoside diphosphate kinase